MQNTNQKLSLKLEREFNATASAVFSAIKEGVLFLQCGAIQSEMKIDFREGGQYYLSFGPDGEVLGKFTKIIPNQEISMTWGNDTHVSITLEARGGKTPLKLKHSDIPSEEWLKAYQGGWEEGIGGLQSKMKEAGQ